MPQDLLLIVPKSPTDWDLDIDIVNGVGVEVPLGNNNVGRQRVAVAAYIGKGTIPGQEEVGADWAGFLANRVSLVECDNQVKANMEEYAGASQMEESPYPIYNRDDGGLSISLVSLTPPAVTGVNS